MEDQSKKLCSGCGVEGTKLKCPCSGALYCGAKCQNAHWSEHKKECTVALGNELVVMRREHGNDAAKVGEAEFSIGLIFQRLGQFADAEKSLLESARIHHLVYWDGHYNVACAL